MAVIKYLSARIAARHFNILLRWIVIRKHRVNVQSRPAYYQRSDRATNFPIHCKVRYRSSTLVKVLFVLCLTVKIKNWPPMVLFLVWPVSLVTRILDSIIRTRRIHSFFVGSAWSAFTPTPLHWKLNLDSWWNSTNVLIFFALLSNALLV